MPPGSSDFVRRRRAILSHPRQECRGSFFPRSTLSFAIKRFSNDLGGEPAAAHVDMERGAGLGVSCGEVGHADAGHERGREHAAGEFADD